MTAGLEITFSIDEGFGDFARTSAARVAAILKNINNSVSYIFEKLKFSKYKILILYYSRAILHMLILLVKVGDTQDSLNITLLLFFAKN